MKGMDSGRSIGIITPAIKELNFRHSGESRNPLRRLDAGSSPA
jgi:hypothetical protein